MVDQARRAAELTDNQLDQATDSVIKFLTGDKQSPEEAEAARALLNTLPKDKLDELKGLSRKATEGYPKLEPGVIYGIYIDHRKIWADQQEAKDAIRQKLKDSSGADPAVKEKLIELTDKLPKGPATTPASPPFRRLSDFMDDQKPQERLVIEQQQAYLKVLGFDVGKTGLDGKAGPGSMTQKALDDFAKKNGIDPKDTNGVQKALLKAVQDSPEAKNLTTRTQKALDGGSTVRPEDVKITQWLLKGNGAAMPASLKNGRMDGVPGPETRTQLQALIERDNPPSAPKIAEPLESPLRKVLREFSENGDDIIRKPEMMAGPSQKVGHFLESARDVETVTAMPDDDPLSTKPARVQPMAFPIQKL